MMERDEEQNDVGDTKPPSNKLHAVAVSNNKSRETSAYTSLKPPSGSSSPYNNLSQKLRKRIEDYCNHPSFKYEDRNEMDGVLAKIQTMNSWDFLQAVHAIFSRYNDGDDGTMENRLPDDKDSWHNIIYDLIAAAPGDKVVLRVGRSSDGETTFSTEDRILSQTDQMNQLTSACICWDKCEGGIVVVPGIITGVGLKVGKQQVDKQLEEDQIFEHVCGIVPRLVHACRGEDGKKVYILYKDVQRLGRVPSMVQERRSQLLSLGATVKFGKQFAVKEEKMDDYLDQWKKDHNKLYERVFPTHTDAGKRLRLNLDSKDLRIHEKIVKGVTTFERKTLRSCKLERKDLANSATYVLNPNTPEATWWENASSLGRQLVSDEEIDETEWQGIFERIINDPSTVDTEAEKICTEMRERDDMGDGDAWLGYNRTSPTWFKGNKVDDRTSISVGGVSHALHQTSLARSFIEVTGKTCRRFALVTEKRKRRAHNSQVLAQIITSIALKKFSDVVITLPTRLSQYKPMVMLVRKCCCITDTNLHMSYGYGLDLEEVANEEETRVKTTHINSHKCTTYEPEKGLETDIGVVSGLRKWHYGEEEHNDGDGKKKARSRW